MTSGTKGKSPRGLCTLLGSLKSCQSSLAELGLWGKVGKKTFVWDMCVCVHIYTHMHLCEYVHICVYTHFFRIQNVIYICIYIYKYLGAG